MSGALAAFEDFFFRQPSPDPAVAAAVTVLYAASSPPPSSPCLDPALQAVAPHLASAHRAAWISALAQPLLTADITTPRRIAAFLGQCSAESAGLRELESPHHSCWRQPTRAPSQQGSRRLSAASQQSARSGEHFRLRALNVDFDDLIVEQGISSQVIQTNAGHLEGLSSASVD
jgi:hypothetical protein